MPCDCDSRGFRDRAFAADSLPAGMFGEYPDRGMICPDFIRLERRK